MYQPGARRGKQVTCMMIMHVVPNLREKCLLHVGLPDRSKISGSMSTPTCILMSFGNPAPLGATEKSSHRVNFSKGESVKNKSTALTYTERKRLSTDSRKYREGRIS